MRTFLIALFIIALAGCGAANALVPLGEVGGSALQGQSSSPQLSAPQWQAYVNQQQALQAQQDQARQLEEMNERQQFEANEQRYQQRWGQPQPSYPPTALPGSLSNFNP